MLKMAKSEEALNLDDEPRSIRDPVKFNRLRVMIEEEAIKPTWGCPLYIAARPGGWLTGEHREAGDRYQQITLDHHAAQRIDPEELAPEMRELEYRRIASRKAKWRDAVMVMGAGRGIVDALVLQEVTLTTERERMVARDALQLLSNFFSKGRTKQVRNVV
jgi:hypothetical protein